MGKYCPLCESSHCPEVGMDNTIGCCICYNISLKEKGEELISLCEGCENKT